MTGFARVDGQTEQLRWHWELRSVNGRGLDLRLRLPPGNDKIETAARRLASKKLTRGNVTIALQQQRTRQDTQISINTVALEQVREAAEHLRQRMDAPPVRAEALLNLRGVIDVVEINESEAEADTRTNAQIESLEHALDLLLQARREEGARLKAVMVEHISAIETLVEIVRASPARAPGQIAKKITDQLHRLLGEHAPVLDPTRLHQEAALLATKVDIEEEIQRLTAHIGAARALLEETSAIGRKFDFLTQEFNREVNTLCSKSNDVDMTRHGLAMKALVDQMREQVQNIE